MHFGTDDVLVLENSGRLVAIGEKEAIYGIRKIRLSAAWSNGIWRASVSTWVLLTRK